MKGARQINPTPVRLDPELKTYLQHRAVDNHRSLGGEISHRLEKSRAQEGACEQQKAV